MKTSYKEVLKKINSLTKGTEFENNIYLVGGAVRDIILNNSPKDIDLCIDVFNGTEKFINYLKKNHLNCCKGFVIYPRYKTSKFTLLLNNEEIEIECVVPRLEKYENGPRKPSEVHQCNIEEDSLRRDFCCNALYLNILTHEILDPTKKGIDDCNNKILRTPCNPEITFIDDPLRMLRAIRFMCVKEFEIEKTSLSFIRPYENYSKLSMERVKSEFEKILMSKNASVGIRLLYKTGLLNYIIPILSDNWNFDQNSKYHSLNLSDHLLSTLDIVIANNPHASLELRIASLLHDISKATTYNINEITGYNTYHGHELESANLSKDILKRLKYSNKEIEKVYGIISNHMLLKADANFISPGEYTFSSNSKRLRKLLRIFGDDLEDSLQLIEGDNLSHHPDYCIKGQIKWIKEKISNLNVTDVGSIKIPISGRDIMNYFNRFDSGIWVRDYLRQSQEIYDEFPNLTKEELLSLLKKGDK